MKIKRLDLKYNRLQVNISKSQVGSVPLEQTYDADTGEYCSNRTFMELK